MTIRLYTDKDGNWIVEDDLMKSKVVFSKEKYEEMARCPDCGIIRDFCPVRIALLPHECKAKK